MPFCASCGTEYVAGQEFCSKCGASLRGDQPAAPVMQTVVSQRHGTNGLAVTSLVLGIVWLYGLGSLLALIFGLIAKRQIRESQGNQGGGGLATAGIVLGSVGLFGVLLIFAIVFLGSTSSSTFSYTGVP